MTGFPPAYGLPPSGPPFDVVKCAVCSGEMAVPDAGRLDGPPLCSDACAGEWERSEGAR